MRNDEKITFEQAASHHVQHGILLELWQFIRYNKKWWLMPIVLTLLVFAILIVLAGTGIAPFIYTLF